MDPSPAFTLLAGRFGSHFAKCEPKNGGEKTSVGVCRSYFAKYELTLMISFLKAVEDARFEQLQRQLKASGWRTVIDEFQIADGVAYGRARLVSADSEDWKRIMDGRVEVT